MHTSLFWKVCCRVVDGGLESEVGDLHQVQVAEEGQVAEQVVEDLLVLDGAHQAPPLPEGGV